MEEIHMKRTETRPIYVRDVQIGGQEKCILQSMTNIPSKKKEEASAQIQRLAELGCEIVRVAVLDKEDAKAIPYLLEHSPVPLVADIHFNHLLALQSIEAGIDAIRINPGNIGDKENTQKVVNACLERKIPIRIGINSGSLEKEFLQKYGEPCVEAMIDSAKRHVDILESMGFYDICLSFKSSNPLLTIESYKTASNIFPYPLHLGVTEAGGLLDSAVKSSSALGVLLYKGIGDTIRVSVSGPPEEEMPIAKQLLKSFNLIENVPELIACPTCGRIQYDMFPIVKEMEEYLKEIRADISVAIMGCPVNGIQEASRADIGIAGGASSGILFRHGEIIRTVPQEQLASALKEGIQTLLKERG